MLWISQHLLAPLAGGLVWVLCGPEAAFWTAAALGLLGTALFYLRFSGAPRAAGAGSEPRKA